jgi:hypothetical protein
MNMMIAITINAGATTAAVRLIVFGNAWLIIPPPAATSTSRNVPKDSENSRRHSWLGSRKSAIGPVMSRSIQPSTPCSARSRCSLTAHPS